MLNYLKFRFAFLEQKQKTLEFFKDETDLQP